MCAQEATALNSPRDWDALIDIVPPSLTIYSLYERRRCWPLLQPPPCGNSRPKADSAIGMVPHVISVVSGVRASKSEAGAKQE
mmetsp:Transcript_12211/g.27889  ORF Transcript_12211/g.27889 Transcript_12211/m.27889 type:complete len:83 (-) Transcript_12211:507-755(-)